MPPPPLDLRKLEEMSLKKIRRQIEHLTTCKIPGLLNGFSNNKCNSANNSTAIEYNQLSILLGCNTTVQWLNNNNNNINSGTTDCEGRMCEVQVTLCYAGKPLPLRLMFTPRQPWMPPDLLLDDPSFMSVITLEMVRTKLPSLDSWAQGGDEALADLVNQLYKLYKQYQEAKLDSCSPQFYNQYNLFGSELHLSEDELEVLVTSSEQLLCVRLPVPFNELPPALFEEMRGEASCVLQLTSKGGDLCFTPFLHLSPRAEALLCGDEQRPFSLPPVPAGCSSLVEYTRSILALVNDTIKTVHQAFESRKQIVAQLLCGYDAAISQYDKVRFSTIELLLEHDSDFNYLVDIVFPHGFPHRCGPRVQLRTISQGDGEEVVCAQVPNLPTVPASDPDAALKVILRAAMSFAPTFRRQRHSRLHT